MGGLRGRSSSISGVLPSSVGAPGSGRALPLLMYGIPSGFTNSDAYTCGATRLTKSILYQVR